MDYVLKSILTFDLRVYFSSFSIQNKNTLELIPQSGKNWDILGRHRSGLSENGGVAENIISDEFGRPITSGISAHAIPTKPVVKQGLENKVKKEVKFREHESNSEVVDHSDGDGEENDQIGKETFADEVTGKC